MDEMATTLGLLFAAGVATVAGLLLLIGCLISWLFDRERKGRIDALSSVPDRRDTGATHSEKRSA